METRHSIAEAIAIQKAFEEQFAHAKGVLGIGIGLNEAKDDLALNVSVAKPQQAEAIPSEFEGLAVVVDVVGKVEAF